MNVWILLLSILVLTCRQQQQQQGTCTPTSDTKDSQELKQTVEHNSDPAPLPSRKPIPKPPACNSATNLVGEAGETEQYENDDQLTEEAMLEAAIRMSMQSSSGGNSWWYLLFSVLPLNAYWCPGVVRIQISCMYVKLALESESFLHIM